MHCHGPILVVDIVCQPNQKIDSTFIENLISVLDPSLRILECEFPSVLLGLFAVFELIFFGSGLDRLFEYDWLSLSLL